MEKIILLGTSSQYSKKAPRYGYTLMGLYWLFYGYYFTPKVDLSIGGIFFIGAFVLIGISIIIYAQLAFSTSSRFAPRIVLKDDIIQYKTGFFKRSIIVKWADISSIYFKPYCVVLTLDRGTENLVYDANAAVSIDIKEAIREVAETKKIEVAGG